MNVKLSSDTKLKKKFDFQFVIFIHFLSTKSGYNVFHATKTYILRVFLIVQSKQN